MRVPSGNVAELLERMGRASTPPVPAAKSGITLAELLNVECAGGDEPKILFVGSKQLFSALIQAGFPAVWAVPGAAVIQAQPRTIHTMIIENAAFDEGPWLNADSGGKRPLAQEIFDAGRLLRARGALVFYLPTFKRPIGIDELFIKSTATVDLAKIPAEDLEEGASQSSLWRFLVGFLDRTRENTR